MFGDRRCVVPLHSKLPHQLIQNTQVHMWFGFGGLSVEVVEELLRSKQWLDLVTDDTSASAASIGGSSRVRSVKARTVSLTIAKYPWIESVAIPGLSSSPAGDTNTQQEGVSFERDVPPLICVLDEIRRIAMSGYVQADSFNVLTFETSVKNVLLSLDSFILGHTAIQKATNDSTVDELVTQIFCSVRQVLLRSSLGFATMTKYYSVLDELWGSAIKTLANEYLSALIGWAERTEQEIEEMRLQNEGNATHHIGGDRGGKKNAKTVSEDQMKATATFVTGLQDFGMEKLQELVERFVREQWDKTFTEWVEGVVSEFPLGGSAQSVETTKTLLVNMYNTVFKAADETGSGWTNVKYAVAGYLEELYYLCDIDGDREVSMKEISMFKRLLLGLQLLRNPAVNEAGADEDKAAPSLTSFFFDLCAEHQRGTQKMSETRSAKVHAEGVRQEVADDAVKFESVVAVSQSLIGFLAAVIKVSFEVLAMIGTLVTVPIERHIKSTIANGSEVGEASLSPFSILCMVRLFVTACLSLR